MAISFLQIPHLPEGIQNGKFIQVCASLKDPLRMVDPILGISFSGDDAHGDI